MGSGTFVTLSIAVAPGLERGRTEGHPQTCSLTYKEPRDREAGDFWGLWTPVLESLSGGQPGA